ncbi:hypothetical protein LTR81_013153 [Elasticomyces elasticus]
MTKPSTKKGGQSGNKKKNTPTPIELCIRCPDPETASTKNHANDFEKCFADFPTRIVDNKPATHSANQLWWGFSSGTLPSDFDFNDADLCEKFLVAAKKVDDEFRPDKYGMNTDLEIAANKKNTLLAKQEAIFKKETVISKEALERAWEAVQGEKRRQEGLKVGGRGVGLVLTPAAAATPSSASAVGAGQVVDAAGSGQKEMGGPRSDRATGKLPMRDGGSKGGSGGGNASKVPAGGQQGSSGGGSGKDDDKRGRPSHRQPQQPAAAAGNAPPTHANEQTCLRCPADAPHEPVHAATQDGLLKCCEDVPMEFSDPFFNTLWPGLRFIGAFAVPANQREKCAQIERSVQNPDRGQPGPYDYDLVVQVLANGGSVHDGVPITKRMAEHAMRLYHGARPSNPGLASGGLPGGSGVLPTPPPVVGSGSSSNAAPPSSSSTAPATDKTVIQTASTYSNPTHTNNTTGSTVERTNFQHAQAYAEGTADRLLATFGTDVSSMDEKARNAALQQITHKFGLRTGFANQGQESHVYTNHLKMDWPKEIHVYSIEMIREYVANAPVYVKKNIDKREVIRVITTNHWSQFLGDAPGNIRRSKWVTDGDLIWSVVPLFDASVASVVPPILHERDGAIRYENETGDRLNIEEVIVRFERTIDLTRDMGQMFYDTTAASFNDSDPGLISRGLNAFFSRYSQENANNVSTSANKSFSTVRSATLDQSTGFRTLRALKGFFLSVRPGIESMYLNVNHATSPFFESILVSDFIVRSRQQGHSENEIKAVLKGVKVRIVYQTQTPFTSEKRRVKFINCVGYTTHNAQGATVRHLTIGDTPVNPRRAVPGITTVEDWYHPTSPARGQGEFPNPALRLAPEVWAVNVGKDPVRKPKEVEWYPANQLMIMPNQPFRGRLTSDQTTEMIGQAVYTPLPHWQGILGQDAGTPQQPAVKGMYHLGYAGNTSAGNPAGGNRSDGNSTGPNQAVVQPFLQAAGMAAGIDFIQVPGRWLNRPGLVYGRYRNVNDRGGQLVGLGWARTSDEMDRPPTYDSDMGKWNLRKIGFATKGTLHSLPVLSLQRNPLIGQAWTTFSTMLRKQLYVHGLIVAPNMNLTWHHAPVPTTVARGSIAWESNFQTALSTLLAQVQQPCPPVLVLLDHKSTDDYACIKRIADQTLGVQTICAVGDKALSTRPGRGPISNWNEQTVSNIALKYNIKCGQDNHHFDPNDLRPLRDVSNQQANTIIIGADVTHPGKSSATATPSIAAVVGSVDDQFVKFPGSMRLQQSRKEDIVDLSEMVKERLLAWAALHNNNFPENLLFYRDGVSESQYDILRRREIPQIQVAVNEAYRHLWPHATGLPPQARPVPDHAQTNWTDISRADRVKREKREDDVWAAEIEAQDRNIPINITFVVVGKRHNTRFYPGDPSTSGNNGNVRPGLVVDQVITHPSSMDFYLQSHEPINGTGRSAHYFVLQNGMRLSVEQLQSVTHTMCYAYARATRGVSYCAPAYYADRLCDRGRMYLRRFLMNHQGYQPRLQIRGGQFGETAEQYAVNIKNDILADTRFQPQPGPGQTRRLSPWDASLDGTMFYL